MSKQETLRAVIDKFWETVPPAWHDTRATIRGVAAERFNLTVEQFQVLRRIRRGMASVSALAESSGTSRSAVSKAVDSLVNKGLVSRSQDPNDRRNIPLGLTDEGLRVMDAIYQETEQWLAGKFSGLSAQELSGLQEALDILHNTFFGGN
jgi:DNA-binding MarR family transcriptional regulator